MGQLKGKCQTIYESYRPRTSHEMREYILYTIDKSVQKARKRGEISDEVFRMLGGAAGGPKHLSQELRAFIQLKKQREYNVVSEAGQADEAKKPEGLFSSVGPHCLLFDSLFESGNLDRAEYMTPTEYNLYLNVDTNTKGHQQWFYFKVKNTFRDKKYTFNIRNFTKPFSLYRQGMRVMMRSKKHQEESEGGRAAWTPAGEELCYWRTDIQRSGWRVPGPVNLDDEEDDD